MDFVKALDLAVGVIRDNAHDGLGEIYLYGPSEQVELYLKNCEGRF